MCRRTVKRTRGFPHQQQERNKSFQSKWNENEFFFSRVSKSVFQACADFTFCQRFLGTASFLDLFKFLLFFSNLPRLFNVKSLHSEQQ